MNSLPGLTIAIVTSLSLAASADPLRTTPSTAKHIALAAIEDAVEARLSKLGVAERGDLEVTAAVSYNAKPKFGDYSNRYPAQVTWSATSPAGVKGDARIKVSGSIDGFFSEPLSSTGRRYFEVETIGVAKMSPEAFRRAEARREAVADKAELRFTAMRQFWGSASEGLTESEIAAARKSTIEETGGTLHRFDFQLRTKASGQKVIARGSIDITNDRTSRESRLRLSSMTVERKDTVVGAMAKGLRRFGGALRGGRKAAR